MKRRARNKDGSWKAKASEILVAAEAVLLEEGYGGLTIQKVTEKAKVSNGHLQYYFPSKDELFDCLLEKLSEDYVLVWQEEGFSSKQSDPEKRFSKFVHFHIDSTRSSDLNKWAWDMWSLSSRMENVAHYVYRFHKTIADEAAKIIGAIAPKLTSDQCDEFATMLVANLEGMTLFLDKSRPQMAYLDNVGDTISDQYIKMIKAAEAAAQEGQ